MENPKHCRIGKSFIWVDKDLIKYVPVKLVLIKGNVEQIYVQAESDGGFVGQKKRPVPPPDRIEKIPGII